MSDSLGTEIECTAGELEQWLATQARAGVPEFILISLLREQADERSFRLKDSGAA